MGKRKPVAKKAVAKAATRPAQPRKQKLPPMRLEFHTKALKEFRKLDGDLQSDFRGKLKKLLDRSERPSPKDRLYGFPQGYYKIKLREKGYRLVYECRESELVVLAIAVGKRNRNIVYEMARKRLG